MSDNKQSTTKVYDTEKIVNDLLECFNLPPPKNKHKVRYKPLEKDKEHVKAG